MTRVADLDAEESRYAERMRSEIDLYRETEVAKRYAAMAVGVEERLRELNRRRLLEWNRRYAEVGRRVEQRHRAQVEK